ELMGMVREGARAVLVFCVQRDDVTEVRPADQIDPDYGRTLREALQAGVEAYALRATLDERQVRLTHRIPIHCPAE
ncbi:MAG: DNA/RNA nuclease SfsA, partial [Betaproteobacteria bacterium]|nr:DNA/RNA nuclease SfsA [Betaproteobacteria bacterium]